MKASPLQLAAELSLARECCYPPKKIPNVQRQRKSCNRMVGEEHSWYNQIPYSLGGWPTNWRKIMPKKFSHCCGGSEPHIRLPRLKDPTKELGIPRKSDLEGHQDLIIWLPQDLGKQRLQSWRAQTNPVHIKSQRKGSVTPQKTEPTLSASVRGSPVEVWVGRGSPQGDSFPGISDSRESASNVGDLVQKIPWRRKWQVLLPGEFYGKRIKAGYNPWGHK